MTAWALILIACTGPGPTGDCTVQRLATHVSRWECRQEAIAREMMDERVRAYCKREGV